MYNYFWGSIVALTRFHVINTDVWYHILSGRLWLHKHQHVPSTYHQCVKGKINGSHIRIAANPTPFQQTKAHLVEMTFYDEWASFGKSSMAKPMGTLMPRWEEIEDDQEPNLRELLIQKKRKNEEATRSKGSLSQCIQVNLPGGKAVYCLGRYVWPPYRLQEGLGSG